MAILVDRDYIATKEVEDLMTMVDADDPDPRDVAALRAALKSTPDLWRSVGNMMNNAATHLIDTLTVPKTMELALRQGWKSLADDLDANDAAPLEQLLIQQVVLSWLRLGFVEYLHAETTTGAATLPVADYWDKRLNAAQRRFLRACETLARVRKINLQAIQINIADQQVNQLIPNVGKSR